MSCLELGSTVSRAPEGTIVSADGAMPGQCFVLNARARPHASMIAPSDLSAARRPAPEQRAEPSLDGGPVFEAARQQHRGPLLGAEAEEAPRSPLAERQPVDAPGAGGFRHERAGDDRRAD